MAKITLKLTLLFGLSETAEVDALQKSNIAHHE
jgi:hypothetical protein